ncbi:MAG: rRNA pseudouridine synthase [Proteobacteria bacterium]|jgi:23S rRNA pseudouridine2605 synthase|nr:rRNA pseudouridine synthase [Pseudomonadota bacterium]
MAERIQKILAAAGHGSRRQAERWIDEGRVTLNGKRAKLGQSATHTDSIRLDGKPVVIAQASQYGARVLVYHKPEGEICTRAENEKRPTVFDNLPGLPSGRWISVGRLDLNTSGLLLFTDDGNLANRLMHPSSEIEREYAARVLGPVKRGAIEALVKGVKIDGKPAAFERVEKIQSSEGRNQWFRVVIKEGRYREVRKLWEAVGYTVNRLKRVRYGAIKLPRDLRAGKYTTMPPRQRDKVIIMAGMPVQVRGAARTKTKSSAVTRTTARRKKGNRMPGHRS